LKHRKRNLRTVAYFLIVVITIIAGLAITLSARTVDSNPISSAQVLISVGTGVLAAGLASLALGVMRWIDDKDSDEGSGSIQNLARTLDERFSQASVAEETRIQELHARLDVSGQQVARELERTRVVLSKYTIVDSSPNLRCVSDAGIGAEFRRAFYASRDSLASNQTIHVDVLGLKLHRFLDDQLDWLRGHGRRIDIRLLLQDPKGAVFTSICHLEGRDIQVAIEDAQRTLGLLDGGRLEDHSWRHEIDNVHIDLRFTGKYQPVTLFRVGGTCCVRPRVSTPLGAATRFYEKYDQQSGPTYYSVYAAHFTQAWNTSEFVDPFKGSAT
jgi:hypothetical protein